MAERKIIPIESCVIDFEINPDADISQPIDANKIDLGYVFLEKPFTGRFYINLEGKDIFEGLRPARTLYPLACVEWLMNNFKSYISEGEKSEPDKKWLNSHLLLNGFGDFSPDVVIYSKDRKTYLGRPKSTIFEIDSRYWGYRIDEVSTKAIDLLRKNPTFRRHNKFAELETLCAENFEHLKSL